MHIRVRETQGGVGILGGRVQGPGEGTGEQFMSNLGTRWTDPVTKGGFQVSRRGSKEEQRGAKENMLCK